MAPGPWGLGGTVGLDYRRGNTLLSDNRSHVSVTVQSLSCANSCHYLASSVKLANTLLATPGSLFTTERSSAQDVWSALAKITFSHTIGVPLQVFGARPLSVK